MRTAFKEWAIVEDALACGDQIVILRKGGIAEGRGGFQVETPRFLLFPTLFHQQRDRVIPSAQQRYDAIAPTLATPDTLRIRHFAEVVDVRRLDCLADAERLRGQHIWRDEIIAERFDWGREQGIHALAVRVHRLAETHDLPMLESYGGCKSWIELGVDIDPAGASPVLDEPGFAAKLARFRDALSPATAP